MFIHTPITGEYLPWLALDYSWGSDATALTVELRDEVLWSDGEVFDAEDVKFTFDLFEQHPEMDVFGLRSQLKSVERLSTLSLRFEFSKPSFSGLEKICASTHCPRTYLGNC